MNIHVYRQTYSNGIHNYTLKEEDIRSVGCTDSIKDIALAAKRKLNNFLGQRTIDFHPFHDVEWPSGLAPRRCFPLTPEEQAEFWLYFTKAE